MTKKTYTYYVAYNYIDVKNALGVGATEVISEEKITTCAQVFAIGEKLRAANDLVYVIVINWAEMEPSKKESKE